MERGIREEELINQVEKKDYIFWQFDNSALRQRKKDIGMISNQLNSHSLNSFQSFDRITTNELNYILKHK